MNAISIIVPDGSMQEVIAGILDRAGITVTMEKKRTKKGKVLGVKWIEQIVFQRPQEIPYYLENGHFDVAIVGQDWIANWGYDFPILLKLPIGRSGNKPVRIVLAVKKDSGISCLNDLPQGCEVATEYVELTKQYFTKNGRTDIEVVRSYGNTEHKVRYGVSAIVDVTESGDSLKENGLKIIDEIMESCTVIAANPASLADENKKPLIDCFVRLINGAYQALKYVMVLANVPGPKLIEASRIIGGLKGPTCSPLCGANGWFALQSIVPRSEEQKIIFKLLQIGVTDIVVNRQIFLVMF